MILSCPACSTRYVVPDSAVGPGGRQVRCAACRHSWFQDPPPLDLFAGEPIAAVPPPEAAPPAPVIAEDEPSAFAPEPPFRPRRNPARRWTAIAVGVALLLVAAIGTLQWFGTPNLLARLGLPIGTTDVQLLLQTRAARASERQ